MFRDSSDHKGEPIGEPFQNTHEDDQLSESKWKSLIFSEIQSFSLQN